MCQWVGELRNDFLLSSDALVIHSIFIVGVHVDYEDALCVITLKRNCLYVCIVLSYVTLKLLTTSLSWCLY